MRRPGYLSGWCGRGGTAHLSCRGAYGMPDRLTACGCACHKAPAPPVVTDQLDLFAADRREVLTP